jgi:hypothetical protein
MTELSSWPWEMFLVDHQKEAEFAASADNYTLPSDSHGLFIHNTNLPQHLGV